MTDVLPTRVSQVNASAEFLELRVAELIAKLTEWHDDNGHFGPFMFCEHTVCKTVSSWLEYTAERRAELPPWHPLHPALYTEAYDDE